jgi:hypothetical protein
VVVSFRSTEAGDSDSDSDGVTVMNIEYVGVGGGGMRSAGGGRWYEGV